MYRNAGIRGAVLVLMGAAPAWGSETLCLCKQYKRRVWVGLDMGAVSGYEHLEEDVPVGSFCTLTSVCTWTRGILCQFPKPSLGKAMSPVFWSSRLALSLFLFCLFLLSMKRNRSPNCPTILTSWLYQRMLTVADTLCCFYST